MLRIPTEVTCVQCNKQVFVRPSRAKNFKYCSVKCLSDHRIALDDKSISFSQARRRMKMLGLLNSCSVCGYSKHPQILGVHHKDHDRSNNSLSNLEAICPNCHSLRHKRHIMHS